MFRSRLDAGQQLAQKVRHLHNESVVVLALPRGGVVVAEPVALTLRAPLDLLIVRKVGHPMHPEYAIAAVAEDGHIFANEREVASIDQRAYQKAVDQERAEARRRREKYLGSQKPIDVAGKVVIIVDDGIATGLTMKAAIGEVRHRNPAKVVVAVPVAPNEVVAEMRTMADDVVAMRGEASFRGSIGEYYDEFPQVSDEEVVGILTRYRKY